MAYLTLRHLPYVRAARPHTPRPARTRPHPPRTCIRRCRRRRSLRLRPYPTLYLYLYTELRPLMSRPSAAAAAAGLLTSTAARQYSKHMNELRSALYAVVSWSSLCALVLSIVDASLLVSVAWLLGAIAVFAGVWLLCRKRFDRLCRPSLVGVDDEGNYQYYGDFARPEHVEIAARFLREPKHKKDDDIDEDAIDRAEAVFQSGIKKFPKAACVYLAYSNFLKYYRQNGQLEGTFVDRSRHLQLSMQLRFGPIPGPPLKS
eukprot:tig00000317_g24043.t1